jgi:hypothetical protein
MRRNVHNIIGDGLDWQSADRPIVAPHLWKFDALGECDSGNR